REAAAKPRSIHQNKRIAATDCAVEHRLVKDRTGIGSTTCPDASRRRQRLGFTRNLRAAPISYGHDSITSQASQAQHTRYKPVTEAKFRHQLLESLSCHHRNTSL